MRALSQAAVRGLMIAALGLQQRPPSLAPATKTDVRQMIQRLHGVQIDTIHVVARSPYLVLWSRLGAYPQRWLDELLAEGALFEYWARRQFLASRGVSALPPPHAEPAYLARVPLASLDAGACGTGEPVADAHPRARPGTLSRLRARGWR